VGQKMKIGAQDRNTIGEVELGFGIEALMVGSNMDGEASGEVLGDPMALLEGDLACGTAMVCMPS